MSAELEIRSPSRAAPPRLARTALQMFIAYLLERVPRVGRLVVKVTDANVPSLRLFESLGFTVHKPMPMFQQTELRLSVASARARGQALSREVARAAARGPWIIVFPLNSRRANRARTPPARPLTTHHSSRRGVSRAPRRAALLVSS